MDDDPVLRINKQLVFAIVVGLVMWYGIIWGILKLVR